MTIIIKCNSKGGFRRCGVRHPFGEAEYADGTFTDEQIAEMENEKHLSVVIKDEITDTYEAMTKSQLLDAISQYQPVDTLGKEKKADLIEMLKAHEEAAGKRNEE